MAAAAVQNRCRVNVFFRNIEPGTTVRLKDFTANITATARQSIDGQPQFVPWSVNGRKVVVINAPCDKVNKLALEVLGPKGEKLRDLEVKIHCQRGIEASGLYSLEIGKTSEGDDISAQLTHSRAESFVREFAVYLEEWGYAEDCENPQVQACSFLSSTPTDEADYPIILAELEMLPPGSIHNAPENHIKVLSQAIILLEGAPDNGIPPVRVACAQDLCRNPKGLKISDLEALQALVNNGDGQTPICFIGVQDKS